MCVKFSRLDSKETNQIIDCVSETKKNTCAFRVVEETTLDEVILMTNTILDHPNGVDLRRLLAGLWALALAPTVMDTEANKEPQSTDMGLT